MFFFFSFVFQNVANCDCVDEVVLFRSCIIDHKLLCRLLFILYSYNKGTNTNDLHEDSESERSQPVHILWCRGVCPPDLE